MLHRKKTFVHSHSLLKGSREGGIKNLSARHGLKVPALSSSVMSLKWNALEAALSRQLAHCNQYRPCEIRHHNHHIEPMALSLGLGISKGLHRLRKAQLQGESLECSLGVASHTLISEDCNKTRVVENP